MITFSRAEEVAPGDYVTSTPYNRLAAAINQRLLSGLGDGDFRIAEYLLAFFRACVVGTVDGKVHAEGEFFEVHQAVEPNVANYPEGGVDPGTGLPEPNGPNIACPFMAWVYGNKSADILAESQRMAKVPVAFLNDAPSVKWAVAKYQRGAKDPRTGYTVSPMRDLAHEFFRFAFPKSGQYNVSFGGFLPGPGEQTPPCVPPCDLSLASCNIFPRVNLDVYFTATRTDVTAAGLHFDTTETFDGRVRGHYAGTCSPCITGTWADDNCPPDNYATHIDWYYEAPSGYFVYLNNGTIDFLPHNDWIEGEYTQVTKLSRDLGEQLSRAVVAFVREFRGSDGQRSGGYNLDHAFDNQEFQTSQYFLAPARGQQIGDSLDVRYPSWHLGPGTYAAGQALTCPLASSGYTWMDGYVATHWFGQVTTPDGPRSIRLRFTHSRGSWSGDVTDVGAINPVDVASFVGLTVTLEDAVVLGPGESIDLEFTELEPYKPNWYDTYAVLRKGGAKLVGAVGGEIADAFVDGQGIDEESAAVIGAEYFNNGCVVNTHDVTDISDPTSVNENAVAEAARRLSKTVRILSRYQVLDYEVTGGDSVLYFTPHPRTVDSPMTLPTDDGDPDVDVFSGFDVYSAADGGFSSRWVMNCWLKVFHNDSENIWRPETYGDQFVDVNRCVFNDSTMGRHDAGMMRFVNRGQTTSNAWLPQMPSGWNMAQLVANRSWWINHNVGQPDATRIKFAKSCRLYEPPLEVRSVERFRENDRDVVKVRFKGRLQSTVGETLGAPESIPRSGWISDPSGPGAWTHADIAAEPFRTVENAIRLYLCWRWHGDVPPLQTDAIPGDQSITGGGSPADGLLAAVLPHFYFVKLIPEAVVDNNATQDASDSQFMHDQLAVAEWYLRCMSEGYVAHPGTLDCNDPNTARAYDWHWASLCEFMFGLRSVSSFATVPTTDSAGVPLLTSADVRPDGPEGFGPLPNTLASSEVFNRLVRVTNALNRVRLMIPWKAEERHTAVGIAWTDGGGAGNHGCGMGTDCASIPNGVSISTNKAPAPVSPGAWSAWTDVAFPAITEAATGHGIGACNPDDANNWLITSTRYAAEMRFSIVDWNIYQWAIPSTWRDMVDGATDRIGALMSIKQFKTWLDASEGTTVCSGGGKSHTFDCKFDIRTEEHFSCVFVRNGNFTLDAGELPIGRWAYRWFESTGDGSTVACTGGSGTALSMQMLTDTVPVLEIPLEVMPEGVEPSWVRR